MSQDSNERPRNKIISQGIEGYLLDEVIIYPNSNSLELEMILEIEQADTDEIGEIEIVGEDENIIYQKPIKAADFNEQQLKINENISFFGVDKAKLRLWVNNDIYISIGKLKIKE